MQILGCHPRLTQILKGDPKNLYFSRNPFGPSQIWELNKPCDQFTIDLRALANYFSTDLLRKTLNTWDKDGLLIWNTKDISKSDFLPLLTPSTNILHIFDDIHI